MRSSVLGALLLTGCLEAPPGARVVDGGGKPGIDAAPDTTTDAGAVDAAVDCEVILTDQLDRLDVDRWTSNETGGATVVVSTGVLDIETTDQPSYGDLVTNAGHDLPGLRATATVLSATGDASIGFIQPGSPVENGFNLFTLDGQLNALRRDETQPDELACDHCADYSPVEHARWRLRATQTHVHYEVGDGGDSWVLLGTSEILRPGPYNLIFTAYTPMDVKASIAVDDVLLERCQD